MLKYSNSSLALESNSSSASFLSLIETISEFIILLSFSIPTSLCSLSLPSLIAELILWTASMILSRVSSESLSKSSLLLVSSSYLFIRASLSSFTFDISDSNPAISALYISLFFSILAMFLKIRFISKSLYLSLSSTNSLAFSLSSLSWPIRDSISETMSSTRSRLADVDSSFFSASLRLFLYITTPAASSKISLLLSGLVLTISAILPCPIKE